MMFNIETIIVYTYGDCDILLTMASDVSHNPTKYRKWWYKNEGKIFTFTKVNGY